MASFLNNTEQIPDLLRLWRSQLQLEEALQKTLSPVTDAVAKKEGRCYFKVELPSSTKAFDDFLFSQSDDAAFGIDENTVPFLRYLLLMDKRSRRFKLPIEHEVFIGFPVFFQKRRHKPDKISTLFKLSVPKLEYPEFSDADLERVEQGLVQTNQEIVLSRAAEEAADFSLPFYLDEIFLLEVLGIDDEVLSMFREQAKNHSKDALEILRLFSSLVLEGEETEAEASGGVVLKNLFKDAGRFIAKKKSSYSLSADVNLYPFALVFEMDKSQPTRQLQNDLEDIAEDFLFEDLKSNHPGIQILLGHDQEKKKDKFFFGQQDATPPTPSQEEVILAVRKRGLSVVQGPPGTGKTQVIRNLMADRLVEYAASLKSPESVMEDLKGLTLVSSTNNRAVDNAIEGFMVDGELPFCLRLGSRISLTGQTLPFLQDYYKALVSRRSLGAERVFEEAKAELAEQMDKIRKSSSQSSKESAQDTSQQRHAAYLGARRLLGAWVSCNKPRLIRLIGGMIEDIEEKRMIKVLKSKEKLRFLLAAFPVVGCTLLSLRNVFAMEEDKIGLTMIDEAGQCAVPYIYPALLRSKKAVIFGDIHQLEPICSVKKEELVDLAHKLKTELADEQVLFLSSESEGLRSAQHVGLAAVQAPLALKEHFRCAKPIIKISMDLCDYLLDLNHAPSQQTRALHYLDIESPENRFGGSWENPLEIKKIVSLLRLLQTQGFGFQQIAVLTPFRGQLTQINAALRKEKIPFVLGSTGFSENQGVATGTVHRFQGGEREVVLFSHVISRGEPTFLNSRVNLLNVAVSRAKQRFIFVGSMKSLGKGVYTSVLREHLLAEGEPLMV